MKHPTQPIEKKVAVAGCKHTTRDFIAGLKRYGYLVDHVLTIDPEKAEKAQVAGYYDLRPFLDAEKIPYTVAETYHLKSEADQRRLLPLALDMLLVMGWQRLIPTWWLEQLSIGAFGMHGSNKPLPHGRGRSPMNWSLIQGKRRFFTHLFRYTPGVDDGDIAGVQLFDITPFDTAQTLHFKNQLAMLRLCVENLPRLFEGTLPFRSQPTEGASFYPKRGAEDGLIYWADSTEDIYDFVRAQTRPFHGTFSFLDDNAGAKITVWRAIPFDTHILWPDARPGEIVEVFFDGSAVVKTGDTSLLVQEVEGHTFNAADIGRRLGSLGKPRKAWPDLPT